MVMLIFRILNGKHFLVGMIIKNVFLEKKEIFKLAQLNLLSRHLSMQKMEQCNLAVETSSFTDHKFYIVEAFIRHTRKNQKPLFPKLNINNTDWQLFITHFEIPTMWNR